MNVKKSKTQTREDKINKSKEIIKLEKKKIKLEKKKIKEEKKKKNTTNKEIYNRKEMILTIIISMIIGAIVCCTTIYIIFHKNNLITNYKELNKLIETYNIIINNYYGNLDKEKLIDVAVDAMVESVGDTYTTYSNTETTESFLEDVEGKYEGIGCTVSTTAEGKIIVVSYFKNSPAEKAGLKEGDIIVKVDGKDYTKKTSNDVANYIKNSKNKKIKLTILRDNEEKEITITREKIEVPVIESKTFTEDNHKIGYISISLFSSVAHTQFEKELKALEKEKIEGLIIDVRNNSGGYLDVVTDITNLFLKKGQIIYQLESNNKKEIIKDTTKEKRNYPLAVIINNDSASASEILASAIKESYNGLVVGVNSYGKGTVQQTQKLNDGSMIKYTVQNWLTPTGIWVNEKGVEPTNKIEENDKTKEDEQLEETISLIKQKLK